VDRVDKPAQKTLIFQWASGQVVDKTGVDTEWTSSGQVVDTGRVDMRGEVRRSPRVVACREAPGCHLGTQTQSPETPIRLASRKLSMALENL
jgi:hypothetical protein